MIMDCRGQVVSYAYLFYSSGYFFHPLISLQAIFSLSDDFFSAKNHMCIDLALKCLYSIWIRMM